MFTTLVAILAGVIAAGAAKGDLLKKSARFSSHLEKTAAENLG
ncbi:hypothetical protein AB0K35_29695 [Micromonospora sp. NPDC053740]